jgi:hypothetical protein
MARARGEVRAAVLADDWLAPPSSLQHLLSKVPRACHETTVIDAARLGATADHYAWMQAPHAVADWLTS